MISKKELSMLHLQKEKKRSDGAQTYFDDENNDEKGSKKVWYNYPILQSVH